MITTSGRVKRKNAAPSAKVVQAKLSPVELLEEALQARDFSKATTMLEFYRNNGQSMGDLPIGPWLAYSAFHMNDFHKAAEVYTEMLTQADAEPMLHIFLACCLFFDGMYQEAETNAHRGPKCFLQTRLLLHIARKTGDLDKVAAYEQLMQDVAEDQLSLAALMYSRQQYQEAIQIYKSILAEASEYAALNVYMGMCYYKMDFYDVSLEKLGPYLQSQSSTSLGINLKACNHYRLYNGKSAESELKVLVDLQRTTYNVENDIVKHNLVVFRNGEDALQTLPPLVDIIPEARLNLAIYHLRYDQIAEAHERVKDIEPVSPQEFIVKAVAYSWIGQQQNSLDALRMAGEYFHFIGSARTECDTIHGRQCMASFLFLQRNFAEVLVYLHTIKEFYETDDTFNYLFGIANAAVGKFDEAEEALTSIKSEKITSEYSYLSWLVRTHIMNQHAKRAWEMYLKMETSAESFSILKLIANDCYKVSAFYYAAKAFDVLERLENAPEYWEGKKGACIGVFQQVFAKQEPIDSMHDVLKMLEASVQLHAQDRDRTAEVAEGIIKTMKAWMKESTGKRK